MYSPIVFEPSTQLRTPRAGESLVDSLFTRSGATQLFVAPRESVALFLDAQIIAQLADQLQEALDEIRQLREELQQRPSVSAINLYGLSLENLQVVHPISVVLEETEAESLARWPETRAYGIGATLAESIANLKQNIATLYYDLTSREPDSMGQIALDTLRTLKTHLRAV